MFKRKSSLFFLYFAVLLALFGSMFLHAHFRRKADMALLLEKREMVRQLELTDLCLFTDARYTRHPSMADLNTPFQDYPLSFEHFPSGSLMSPPPHLQRRSVSDSVSDSKEKKKKGE
jgi:hypothetical protein